MVFFNYTRRGNDLERVQKNACHLILKDKYSDYEQSIQILGLQNLNERRRELAIKFGNKCLKIDEMKDLFQASEKSNYFMRNAEKYNVKFASGQRLFKSTIPTLQRLMNNPA